MRHDLVYIIVRIFYTWTSILLGLMIILGILAGAFVLVSRFDSWLIHNYKPYEPFIIISLILVVASLFASILITLTDWKDSY